ncbi:MAG: TlyA family RNA methyltransferase [Candidatus Promineifilaceae bacterium]|nr:TlyA family RNA methyltransferase [Candidatus Promineifilaceae bacterium]
MVRKKGRLDELLVAQGLAPDLARAQALIMAGDVQVDGQPVIKAGAQVLASAEIEVREASPYASRGGFKLAAALDAFDLDVEGCVCADVGACTGGFTDVLLQRGAARVYAIDVGYGLLAWKLRQDERVVVLERTNARYLEALPEPVAFISVDVSFISLRLVLPVARRWLVGEENGRPSGDVVALIKPQFEAEPESVGQGGVVRDAAVHRRVLTRMLEWAAEEELSPAGLIRSPIEGATGNVEFLVWLRPGRETTLEIERAVAAVMPGTS